jgi:gluconolactonase
VLSVVATLPVIAATVGCAGPQAAPTPQSIETVVSYSPQRRIAAVVEPGLRRCEVRDLSAHGRLLWAVDGVEGEFVPSDDGRRLLRLSAPTASPAGGPLVSFYEDGMPLAEYGAAELLTADAAGKPWRRAPGRIEEGVSEDGGALELITGDGRTHRFDLLTGRPTGTALGGREAAVEPIRRRLRALKTKAEIAAVGRFTPAGIAADGRGEVYFTDASAGAIGRIGPSGTTAALYTGLTGGAEAIAAARDGGLTVALRDDGRIVHIPPAAGAPARVLVESFQGRRLLGPADLVYDRRGDLYFIDSGRNAVGKVGAVYVLTGAGELVQLARGLEQPGGIALADDERVLLITETRQDRVLAMSIDRTGKTPALDPPRILARLPAGARPTSAAVDADGVVYVLSSPTGRIEAIAPNGEIVARLDAGGRRPGRLCFGAGTDETALLLTHADKGQGRIVRLDVGRPAALRALPGRQAPAPAGGKATFADKPADK